MSTASFIKVSRHASNSAIVTLEFNRPETRNALSMQVITEFEAALAEIAKDASVRVLILAGAGKSFCAGMDLRAVADDPIVMGNMLRALGRATLTIRKLTIPTIAKVQGAAIGGGCGLMVVCDFAVVHDAAKVGYPEVDLGICPAVVAPWLVKKIGAGAARAMLLAGGTMSGEEGFRRGLATHLATLEELDAKCDELALRLAKGGPNAIAATKDWLAQLDGSYEDAVILEAAEISARLIAGEEAQARLKSIWKA